MCRQGTVLAFTGPGALYPHSSQNASSAGEERGVVGGHLEGATQPTPALPLAEVPSGVGEALL